MANRLSLCGARGAVHGRGNPETPSCGDAGWPPVEEAQRSVLVRAIRPLRLVGFVAAQEIEGGVPGGAFGPAPLEPKIALLRAAAVIGALLADGIGDAILVRGETGAGQSLRLAYNILQAAGCRSFKTDYVACPSCGRTLFNLQTVTGRIKARTEHLKGVKIAVMGCIVNGPGEMADADFGY